MDDYLKTIKKQNEIISSEKINKLNEKIDAQQTKMEDDKALFSFLIDTLKSFLTKIESIFYLNC